MTKWLQFVAVYTIYNYITLSVYYCLIWQTVSPKYVSHVYWQHSWMCITVFRYVIGWVGWCLDILRDLCIAFAIIAFKEMLPGLIDYVLPRACAGVDVCGRLVLIIFISLVLLTVDSLILLISYCSKEHSKILEYVKVPDNILHLGGSHRLSLYNIYFVSSRNDSIDTDIYINVLKYCYVVMDVPSK